MNQKKGKPYKIVYYSFLMNQSRTKRYLEAGSRFSLLSGIAATIWFMFQNGDPDSFTWYLIAIPFLIWTLLPFTAVFLMMKKASDAFHTRLTIFIVSAIISFGGIWILYDAFVIHLDPQSGLIFLFLPILQLLCISAGYAITVLQTRLAKNR
jgi:hypothetical protein